MIRDESSITAPDEEMLEQETDLDASAEVSSSTKSRMVGVRFAPEEYNRLASAALRENRSMSALIRMVMIEWAKKNLA